MWDVIIVGQGLAGTTLAWCLLEKGRRVLIIDPNEKSTCSKIAAGLVTPITGKRLALDERYDDFYQVAKAFYQRIETQTQKRFFFERTAIRLFQSTVEQDKWCERAEDPSYASHLLVPPPTPLLDEDTADISRGGFAMRAAQLHTAAFLDASRNKFEIERKTLNWETDVQLADDHVKVGNHQTRHLISCEGYAATQNPYFSWVPFDAAKGEILSLAFQSPLPQVNIHRGIWIAPTISPEISRLGATYDTRSLDTAPTESGRNELETKLQSFMKRPYKLLDHQAAIRPIIFRRKAVIGLHPEHPRIGFFNSLGSKGSLRAPYYASLFADHLADKKPLPADIDIQKVFKS